MTVGSSIYFDGLGVNPGSGNMDDLERLREAYNRSHDIRKFEIEMYWRRSAYLWTLQAAALAGLALTASEFELTSWNCGGASESAVDNCFGNQMRFLILLSIWCFGTFSAYIWLLLLKGAKHWQNNWERHVDVLEDYFSGALYKTYPTKNSEPPYSVSKLNELMAAFMLILWLGFGVSAASVYASEAAWIVLAVPGLGIPIFFAWYFDSCLRMSDYGRSVDSTGTDDTSELGIVRRPAPRFRQAVYKSDGSTE